MTVCFQPDQRSAGMPYRRIPSHFEPCAKMISVKNIPSNEKGGRAPGAPPLGSAHEDDRFQSIGWDTSVYMAAQLGPWGWTVWNLGLKCLLDTLVLVQKCPYTSDPSEQCRSVSVPICPGSEVFGYRLALSKSTFWSAQGPQKL